MYESVEFTKKKIDKNKVFIIKNVMTCMHAKGRVFISFIVVLTN